MRVCFAILYDIVLDTTLYDKISLDCLFSCLLYYVRIFLRASYKNMLHCKIVCRLPWYYMILRYHIVCIRGLLLYDVCIDFCNNRHKTRTLSHGTPWNSISMA